MKKQKLKRYSYFWLYAMFSIGIPIALVSSKYQIFKTVGSMQITGMGLIMILVLFLFFKKQFKEMINTLEKSTFKSILQNYGVPVGIGIAYIVVLLVRMQIDNFLFILGWSTVSNAVAVFFKVKHLQYVPITKEEENKDD